MMREVSARPVLSLVMLATAATSLCACTAASGRVLPRHALLARAWSAAEPPATAQGLRVVAFAVAQVGKRYCWGGTGPSCFGCSGLTESAWSYAGVQVPRTSGAIARSLPSVPLEEIRAGDILWWPGHVGIYAGRGLVVEALDARHGVVIRAAADPYRAFRPPPHAAATRTARLEEGSRE